MKKVFQLRVMMQVRLYCSGVNSRVTPLGNLHKLTSDHVNELVCLHHWIKAEMKMQESTRGAKRIAKNQEYAVLSHPFEANEVPEDDLLEAAALEANELEPPVEV